ncbi:hypothetical protein PDIG_17090 [Penicillium digitatum PHI26]|uniref:Uncharacterized protein n=2 Tax=Penicillium digitatum TaxID=36651 RepID=K9G4V1_PEND2|nr:hypothetical protein PDIP_55010 [Penicillium digitatum Pd1]EKV11754.1 hypothetical protein PDIP_55010 [Penicillium digitatum Pd1]EKV16995.1 hypothetical protein PDIG_17090 [Penicillium digitatum PHI26]
MFFKRLTLSNSLSNLSFTTCRGLSTLGLTYEICSPCGSLPRFLVNASIVRKHPTVGRERKLLSPYSWFSSGCGIS